MYAVIETGGKQYRVEPGQRIRVEKLDAEEGASLDLDKVLMIADGEDVKIGKPYVDGGKVTFRRRKHHQKVQGHRQAYTELEITAING